MTKPDLMAELAEGIRLRKAARRNLNDEYTIEGSEDSVRYIRHLIGMFAKHHAELEAVVRDAARWRYLATENNKGPRGQFRICWADPTRNGLLTTDGVSVDGKDEEAIVRIIDQAMHNSAREGL